MADTGGGGCPSALARRAISLALEISGGMVAGAGRQRKDGERWVLCTLRGEGGGIGDIKALGLPALVVEIEH